MGKIEEIDVSKCRSFDFMQDSTNVLLSNKINELVRKINELEKEKTND